MRSPVLTSMSYSRGGWVALTELARWMRSSVVLPMALTTATTSLPWRRVRAMWSATARIRSASPTEVPPNFWTTSGIRTRLQTAEPPARQRWSAVLTARHPGACRHRRGDPNPLRGLGRVSGRAQRQESPSARGQGGPAGGRGQATEAPQADPQHRDRRGDRRHHRRHRLSWSPATATTPGLQVQGRHHHHDGSREGRRREAAGPGQRGGGQGGLPGFADDPDGGRQPEVHRCPAHDDRHDQAVHGHVQDDHRDLRRLAGRHGRPQDGEQLRVPGQQGLLQLRGLLPGHPRLRAPDRQPGADQRRDRARLHHPRRAPGQGGQPRPAVPTGLAGHGQHGPAQHRRQPVLHRLGPPGREPAQLATRSSGKSHPA